ncbi:hypothetical protein WJX81_002072 [Elliptochloris bilobata]|uniref:Uncharacterized protein n=1 Tax=Elliptochloris bilobata TaxID=381761 RepID=A0AAW1SDH2_9CHLO
MNSLFSSLASTSVNPDRLGAVRILIIGNAGCGKTTLAHFLANGEALRSSTPTVGCNTFVKLLDFPEEVAYDGAVLRTRPYFVEFWDVGGHERYKTIRNIFYSDLNGIIIVHDSTTGRAQPSVRRWANEVAARGRFVARCGDTQAAANPGALPVPVLVVANKADLRGGALGLGAALSRSLAQLWQSVLEWLRMRKPEDLVRQCSNSSTDGSTAGSLSATATQGRIDTAAVTEFLRECIARRYYVGAGGPPSTLRTRGPPPPRASLNPSTPPFSGFHETAPAGTRTPPQAWGTPVGGPPPPPSLTGAFTSAFAGARGLGSRTASYQSMASSSDYGWGSASEAGGAAGGAHSAFQGSHAALDVNGRIDD